MSSPTVSQGDAFARLFGPWGATAAATQPQPADTREGGAPRRSVAAAMQAADAEVLRGCDVSEMEDQILAILAAAQRRPLSELVAGQGAPDGGVTIDSMSAVFVCSVINRTIGSGLLRRLPGASQPADFVSTRALANLLCRLRSNRAA
jgi:hypothetical protein